MKKYSKFDGVKLKNIHPEGWLKKHFVSGWEQPEIFQNEEKCEPNK